MSRSRPSSIRRPCAPCTARRTGVAGAPSAAPTSSTRTELSAPARPRRCSCSPTGPSESCPVRVVSRPSNTLHSAMPAVFCICCARDDSERSPSLLRCNCQSLECAVATRGGARRPCSVCCARDDTVLQSAQGLLTLAQLSALLLLRRRAAGLMRCPHGRRRGYLRGPRARRLIVSVETEPVDSFSPVLSGHRRRFLPTFSTTVFQLRASHSMRWRMLGT